MTMKDFTIEMHEHIATVWMDQPGSEVNVLSLGMHKEFTALLDRLENDDDIHAAILISGKPNVFIAGADIKGFMQMESSAQAEQLSREGNALLQRMHQMNKPVIAAINGAALGGGLEVALACHHRIASTDAKTVFGLPEVKLGILPGGGGLPRMLKKCGLRFTLDAALSGKNIYPYKALKSGLIDALTHKEGLHQAALAAAKDTLKSRRRKLGLLDRFLDNTKIGRNLVLKKARQSVLAKTRGNYPAPLKILQVIETHLNHGRAAGQEAEIMAFAELHGTPACKNLMQLFLSMQDNKKLANQQKNAQVERIAMLGAGFMGAGITEVSIKNGYPVVLKDIAQKGLGQALKTIWTDFTGLVKKKAMLPSTRDRLMAHIQPTTDYAHIADADLVIEAVFEDMELKQRILADVEAQCSKTTVFASNTSSLPITRIAEQAKNPQNVLGMHYFSPVPKMPLLELIVTDKTTKRAMQTAINVGVRQGKTVVVVKDGPGFYTTRVLSALTHEALQTLKQGARIEDVDGAMKDWGFPVGPLALLDEVGIDVAAHIASGALGDMYATRGIEHDDSTQKLMQAGLLGRKAGKGFYLYPKKGRKTVNQNIYAHFGGDERQSLDKSEVQERIGLCMVNECILCLQEGILSSAEDGDLAAILGLGFPPFTGGPFKFADAMGHEALLQKLKALEAQHGVRFKPASLLEKHAAKSQPFRA